MSKQKPENLQKINKSQNDKIVYLIKSKLTPMHKKPKFLPRILQPKDLNTRQTRHNTSGQYIYKDLPICEKYVKREREIDTDIQNIPLLKKVRSHIEEKKKVITQEEIENARLKMPRVSFGSFIELFSRSEEVNPSRTSFEFSKFKRQSLALNVFDNIENPAVKQNEKSMNEAEVCLMNAKFRKQLNHRKIIAICKIRNKA